MEICQINGDGIGAEVVPSAIRVLSEVLDNVTVKQAEAGWQTFLETGNSVPATTLDSIRQSGSAIFGAVSSPSKKVEGYRSAILKMRQALGLYANIRPVDGRLGSPDSNIRFVVVRENSEGLYSGRERISGDEAIAERVITEAASVNIGEMAVRTARIYGMNKITIVHKANVLPVTDGLFRDSVLKAIASQTQSNETFEIDEMLVDVAALRLVSEPERFQVIVTTNLFGDILSDIGAHWCGGLGMAPSINLGTGIAICEPVHGSAPDIANQGIANPRAAILSVALLCRYFWEDARAADMIEDAVRRSTSSKDENTTAITERVILELANIKKNLKVENANA